MEIVEKEGGLPVFDINILNTFFCQLLSFVRLDKQVWLENNLMHSVTWFFLGQYKGHRLKPKGFHCKFLQII